jgi:hypothetical protein
MGVTELVSTPITGAGIAAAADTKRTGLSFKEYPRSLRPQWHRDLISRVDLERVATQRDEYTRGRRVLSCGFRSWYPI